MVALEKKTLTVEVWQDRDSESPLEWGNPIDVYYYNSSRYTLGNVTSKDFEETLMDYLEYTDGYRNRLYNKFSGRELFDLLVEQINKKGKYYVSPVYAYIHSGVSLSTSPFSCRWDSGLSGFAVVNVGEFKGNYGLKRVTKERLSNWVDGQIETFSDYISGDVYGFTVTNVETGEDDSCGGFYGEDYASAMAENYAHDEVGYTREEMIELFENATIEY